MKQIITGHHPLGLLKKIEHFLDLFGTQLDVAEIDRFMKSMRWTNSGLAGKDPTNRNGGESERVLLAVNFNGRMKNTTGPQLKRIS